VTKKKTFWVQMVKTIHVPIVAADEDAASNAAKENDVAGGNALKWAVADAIVYDVNQEGA